MSGWSKGACLFVAGPMTAFAMSKWSEGAMLDQKLAEMELWSAVRTWSGVWARPDAAQAVRSAGITKKRIVCLSFIGKGERKGQCFLLSQRFVASISDCWLTMISSASQHSP